MEIIGTWLETHNLLGLCVGLATFIIIGIFHPAVIKGYYYCGTRIWTLFLFLGIAMGIVSLLCSHVVLSTLCGVVAFSSFWSIKEIFEQRERVRKGWFPENPKRRNKE